MKEENSTLKLVAGIGVIGGVIFLGYRYFKRIEDEERIKAETQIIKADTIKSGETIKPTINEVNKLISQNPKSQTYTKAEYKNFAQSLYEYFKGNQYPQIISLFKKMKTNTDLMLLSIYYGVKVFKSEDIFGNFKINSYNLGQSINNLTNDIVKKQLSKNFENEKITFNLY